MSNSNLTSGAITATPKGYGLEVCTITSNTGIPIDITELVQDIKITESLYQSGMTVDIFVYDALNLIEELRIAGNEYVEIIISRAEPTSKDKYEIKKFELKLRVAELKNYSTPQPSTKAYTLQCVSKHVYLNNYRLLKRSFSNTASNLIKSIVSKELQSAVDIKTKSNGLIKGIYPRIQPLQAISWLLRNSYDDGTPFYFYETPADGLIFTSYNKILENKDEVYATYNNYPMFNESFTGGAESLYNVFNEEKSKITKMNSHLNMSKLKAAFNGAFGSVLNKIDISTKKVTQEPFKYKKTKMMMLNDHSPISGNIKIGEIEMTDFKNTKHHYVSYNMHSHDEFRESSINDSGFYTIIKGNYHKVTDANALGRAQAHHHNLDTIKQEIVIPGDFSLSCGKIVNLNIIKNADITIEQEENDEFKDTILSGKHLVTQIVHHFGKEGYMMNVVLKKDSFISPLEKGL